VGQIMGYILGTWAWPVAALIVIAILAVFGYAMYRWKKQEPKAPGAENGADARRDLGRRRRRGRAAL
jgi:uncharacterized iron-regulated membrane protein